MEKLVKIRLFDSTAGKDFAYGKGENEVPESRAREFVACGLAEYMDAPKAATKPHEASERAISQQAKKAEKR